MFNFWTGDGSGLLKKVVISNQVEKDNKTDSFKSSGSNNKKRSAEVEKNNNNKEQKPQYDVKVIGRVDKKRAVDAMNVIDDQMIVGRMNGIIEIFNIETEQLIMSIKAFELQSNATEKTREKFIGLCIVDGKLISCTNKGTIQIFSQNNNSTITIDLGQDDLCVMKCHPCFPHIFATGGKERDLSIWDLNQLSADGEVKSLWTAKNVRNDFLDLRQPIWIADLVWLHSEHHQTIVTCTEYHEIRMYDTTKARRPIFNISYGEHPLRSVAITSDKKHVIVGNTIGETAVFDLQKGLLQAKFKGITGAVTNIQTLAMESWIAITSIDRFLRIYNWEKGDRTPIHKVFLKQRLTKVYVDESHYQSTITASAEGGDVSENDGDALWNSMTVVEQPEKSVSKSKKHTKNNKRAKV